MIRFILSLLVCMTNANANTATPTTEFFNFKVLLNDREIGWHTFVVEHNDHQVTVKSNVSMDFTVLRVKKVKYRHQANEIWQKDCMVEFESSTQRNGKLVAISGKTVNGNFFVQREDGETPLGACVKSFPYWRPKWLESEFLLNVETGKYTPISVKSNIDPVTQVIYKTIELPKTQIHLEYDKAGDWQSLEFDLNIVGTLRYERVLDTIKVKL
jgi:hypothetical protein